VKQKSMEGLKRLAKLEVNGESFRDRFGGV
jgi:hypothetical protein